MQKGSIMPLVTFAGLALMLLGAYVWYVYTPVILDTSVLPKKDGAEEFSHWKKKKNMPTARSDLSAAVLGNKIYAIGGFSGLGSTLKTVEVYDTVTDTWSTLADLPQGRYGAEAVAYQGKIYVVGGYDGIGKVAKNNVYVYDPESGRWEDGVALPEERADHGAVVMGNHLYVVGGVTDNRLSSDFLRFNFLTKKWTPLPRIPTARESMAIAATNNQILVAGGRANASRKNLGSLEIFNIFRESTPVPTSDEGLSVKVPPVGEWSKGPRMTFERGGVSGVQLGDAIVVSGGEKLVGTFSEVEAYDIRTRKWHSFPPMNYARQGAASVVVGDTLYVIGGGRHAGLSVSNIVEALNVRTR